MRVREIRQAMCGNLYKMQAAGGAGPAGYLTRAMKVSVATLFGATLLSGLRSVQRMRFAQPS